MSKRTTKSRRRGDAAPMPPAPRDVAVPAASVPQAEPPIEAAGAYALLAEYQRRSLGYDPPLPELSNAPGAWRAIGFRVGDRHFASGIDEISEILMTVPPVTRIPATRPWLLGIANVRGNLVAVVDLKLFLLGQHTHLTSRARVLVVRQRGGNVGLLVDELLGQRSLTDADRIGAEPEADERLARFVLENVKTDSAPLGRFSMVALTHAPEFQHAAV